MPSTVTARVIVPPPTSPAVCAGATAVRVVELTIVTLVAGEPSGKTTAALPLKFVPVKVRSVPPAVVPVFGLSELSVGVWAIAAWRGKKQANSARTAAASAADGDRGRDRIATSRRDIGGARPDLRACDVIRNQA